MIIGKVSYWDTKSRNLIVELDNGSLVRLTPEQISIYPLDKLDKEWYSMCSSTDAGKRDFNAHRQRR